MSALNVEEPRVHLPEPDTGERSHPPISVKEKALGIGALSAALLAMQDNAQAQREAPPIRRNPEHRLVHRVTMGFTPEELAIARKKGFEGYLEYQMNYQAIDDSAVNAYVAANFPIVNMPSQEVLNIQDGSQQAHLAQAMLYRSVFSKRQLYERMVEFWTDHLTVTYDKVGSLKVMDDREVIRPHALGKFSDMLRASAHSPGMLENLDNSYSYVGNPNQNYVRELLELHSIGVNSADYTQKNIEEMARAFTGLGWLWNPDSSDHGKFIFRPEWHDYDKKVVMGKTIPAGGGLSDADKILDMLIAHPDTPRFIGTKMTRWLLGVEPSPALLDAISKAYFDSGTDIKAMIRVILTRKNLDTAPLKFKRPYHLMASALRATKAQVSDWLYPWYWTFSFGQAPYQWKQPNGYPDKIDYWVGMMLTRWNFVFEFTNNWTNGITVDVTPYKTLGTSTAVADKINADILGGAMPYKDRAELAQFLKPNPPSEQRIRDAIGLALASPTFQWY